MYLARLEASGVSHHRWPTDCHTSPATLTQWFTIADDTLNSWKEVHDAFDRLQGNRERVQVAAHRAFTAFVEKAVGMVVGYLPTVYAAETVAFALLKVWIGARQEELKNAHANSH